MYGFIKFYLFAQLYLNVNKNSKCLINVTWNYKTFGKKRTFGWQRVTGLFAHGQFARGQFAQIGSPKVKLGYGS